jgi:Fur family transcriptional regulator, peroxide stress response regulator
MVINMLMPLEQIRKQFQESGHRFTSQRYAIYKALAMSKQHPSAEELYLTVKKSYPTLSLNTVYNTLETLKSVGIASKIGPNYNRARFDANQAPHHHLLCLHCKKIEDLHDKTLDRLSLSSRLRHRYRITGHRVEFHGYCYECQQKRKTKRT